MPARRFIAFLVLALLAGLAASPRQAAAQLLPGNLCPPPGRWVNGGNGFMCQCPDGRFLSLGQTCGSYRAAPPQIGDRCADGRACPTGTHCSWKPGRCVRNGYSDCGDYSCAPGSKCSLGDAHACIPEDTVDCGNGRYCNSGQKCTANGHCVAENAIECGSGFCRPGSICAPGNRCLTQAQIDSEKTATEDRTACDANDSPNDTAIAACSRRIANAGLSGHNLAVTYSNRGLRWYRKGDFDRAIADFDASLRADRTYTHALNLRGLSYYNTKQVARALADFNQMISLEPTNALAFNNAAWMRRQEGDLDGALRDANQAIRFDARSATAHATRGEVRRLKGDTDGAIADLTAAINFNPSLPSSFTYRGLAYRDKGEDEAAAADFRHAAALAANSLDDRTAAAIARQQLADIEADQRNPILAMLRKAGLPRSRWPLAGIVLVGLVAAGAGFFHRTKLIAAAAAVGRSLTPAKAAAPVPAAATAVPAPTIATPATQPVDPPQPAPAAAVDSPAAPQPPAAAEDTAAANAKPSEPEIIPVPISGGGGGASVLGIIVNVFFPGIGTMIAGKPFAGLIQLLLYFFGLALVFTGLLALIGAPICLFVWIWALISAATARSRPIQVVVVQGSTAGESK